MLNKFIKLYKTDTVGINQEILKHYRIKRKNLSLLENMLKIVVYQINNNQKDIEDIKEIINIFISNIPTFIQKNIFIINKENQMKYIIYIVK